MYRLTDYATMLCDERRVVAYRKALAACVSETSVVLDLGAGLGTFGILAATLGAARVYVVDSAAIITAASEIANASGVAERMVFIEEQAEAVTLPEKVDVLVSDLAGALPLFERHIPAVIYAREHLLRTGGTMVPSSSRLLCAPISSPELHAKLLRPWRSVEGVDFSPAEKMALHTPHAMLVSPQDLVGEPRSWAQLDYASISSPNVSGDVEWEMSDARVIHGVALWFESTLHGEITYSSGPFHPASVHSTMVLPLLEPVELRAGGRFSFSIEAVLVSDHYVTTWKGGEGSRQSTFFSEPLSAKSLAARVAPPEDAVECEAEADLQNSTFRVSERVLIRRVGDDYLLLHLSSETYHVLTGTAARSWEILSSNGEAEAVVSSLMAEYDVDRGRASKDVSALIARLEHERLISRA